LGGKIADAWINFARMGDPNHGNIPSWPKVSSWTVPTMIFDSEVKVITEVPFNIAGDLKKIEY
jgi:para-nitrobenzyl esterase